MPDDASGQFAVPSGPAVVAEVFDGEAVVVHLTTGFYYAFDRRATQLWEELSSGADAFEDEGERREFLAFLVHEELASCAALAGAGGGEWPGVERFTDMADLLVLDPIHDIDLDGAGWPVVPGAAVDAAH